MTTQEPQTPDEDFSRRRLRLLLAFEGGGAKGVAHVGALKEMEQSRNAQARSTLPYASWPQFELAGVCGTSIGALIAALVASGYTSDDFIAFDPLWLERAIKVVNLKQRVAFFGRDCMTKVRQRLCGAPPSVSSRVLDDAKIERLTAVFGYRWRIIPGWWLIQVFRFVSWQPWIGVTLLACMLGLVNLQIWHMTAHSGWLMLLQAALNAALLVRVTNFVLGGLCSTRHLISILDATLNAQLLRRISQLRQEDNDEGLMARGISADTLALAPGSKILFKHFRGLMPLRIVTTDIESREMRLFSEINTPDVSVAEAVAASLALPVIFEPVTITGCFDGSSTPTTLKLCDGGIVSNIPMWAFDPERSLDPDLYCLGLEVSNRSRPTRLAPGSPYREIAGLVKAAIFGRKELETRLTRRIMCALDSRLSLLAFRSSPLAIAHDIERARANVRTTISQRVVRQENYKQIMSVAHAAFSKAIHEVTPEEAKKCRIRVAVLEPAKGSLRALKMVATYGFDLEHDSDDRLIMPIEGSVSGLAFAGDASAGQSPEIIWVEGNPYDTTTEYYDPDHGLHGAFNRYRRPMFWRDRAWLLAIPVPCGADEDGVELQPKRVLCIDSNARSEYFGIEQVTSQAVFTLLGELTAQFNALDEANKLQR